MCDLKDLIDLLERFFQTQNTDEATKLSRTYNDAMTCP